MMNSANVSFTSSIRVQLLLLPELRLSQGSAGVSPSCHWVQAG